MSSQAQTRDTPSSSAALLFSNFSLLFMLCVFLVSVWFRLVPLVILTGIVVATGGVAKGWSLLSLKRVYYERRLETTRLFPGEETDLTVRVTNHKLLPVSWLEIDDGLPQYLDLSVAGGPAERSAEGHLLIEAMLMWYRRATWLYKLKAVRRGYYQVGPVNLRSADIFGLYPRSKLLDDCVNVVVYPRIFPVAGFVPLPKYPPGENREVRQIFQDPMRTVGIRDYTDRDPMKNIHWKASARSTVLQTRVFEPTTTVEAALLVDVEAFDRNLTESRVADFELALSTAASLAVYCEEKSYPVGLYINAMLADESQDVKLPPSRSPGQVVSILETLAKARLELLCPFADFLDMVKGGISIGTTLVFILPKVTELMALRLANMRRMGRRVMVVLTGQKPAVAAAGLVPTYYAGDILAESRSTTK